MAAASASAATKITPPKSPRTLESEEEAEDLRQKKVLDEEIEWLDRSGDALTAWEDLKEYVGQFGLPLFDQCSFPEFVEAACRQYKRGGDEI